MRDEATEIRLITSDTLPDGCVLGGLVVVSHVRAVNIFKDVREMLTNVTGGNMTRYEKLMKEALTEIENRFRAELLSRNYSGAICVRIAHPQVVGGGAELIMYGTGFSRK